MSNAIGYAAAAIRSGDVKYQEGLVDLVKQAAEKKPASTDSKSAKPADRDVGRNVDIKV